MRKTGKLDATGRPRVQTVNTEPSQTVQSDAHLTDIVNILSQYGVDAQQMLDETKLVYGDVSQFGDYHDVMLQVKQAEIQFLELPSKVREIYGHSVEHWLDTANDADKRQALVEAGFIKPVATNKATGPKGSTGSTATATATPDGSTGSSSSKDPKA